MKTSRRSGLTLAEVMAVLVLITLVAIGALLLSFLSKKLKGGSDVSGPSMVEMGSSTHELNTVGNNTYIPIGKPLSTDRDIFRVLSEVRSFELKNPSLRVTGQQVIVAGSYIWGVILRHEPVVRTNASPVLEGTNPG